MNAEVNKIYQLETELRQLRNRNKFILLLLILPWAYILFTGFLNNKKDGEFDTVFAREIIIRDHTRAARIILSPEIKDHPSRKRKDLVEGILILDKEGTDRVMLGATPNVQSAGEIYSRVDGDIPYGFAFNDDMGNERGGMGYYAGRGLVSFGMDHPGSEALTMFVADRDHYGQKVGFVMQDGTNGQVVYIGNNLQSETMFNMDTPGKGRLSVLMDSTGKASLRHFDYDNGTQETLLQSGERK